MKYVYILESVAAPGHHYTGIADDLRARLKRHNAEEVSSTARYAPWRLRTYIALDDADKAFALEKYLKSPSGRAFARKRLQPIRIFSKTVARAPRQSACFAVHNL